MPEAIRYDLEPGLCNE